IKSRTVATAALRDELREARRREWLTPSPGARQDRSPAVQSLATARVRAPRGTTQRQQPLHRPRPEGFRREWAVYVAERLRP
ncbi:MAG: hypothetical protein ACREV9_11580, partial [Burkholderiales bacterium]